MRSSKRLRNMVFPPIGYRQGKWSEAEHRLMCRFVRSHRKEIIDYLKNNLIHNIRSNKRNFFVRMAVFIQTKDERQCKSRFQKQEMNLMRALRLPKRLMERLERLRGPAIPLNRNPLMSTPPTDTPLTDDQADLDKSESSSIYTLRELKEILWSDLMPKILDDPLKSHVERFIRSVPSDPIEINEIPSFNLNVASLLPWQVNVSYMSMRNQADSFFEE